MFKSMKQGKGLRCRSLLDSDNRKTSQGYIDIKKLTIEQLDELIFRQNKLLQNKSFLNKLPDKGERILLFKSDLEVERKKKQEEFDETCKLLLNLSLNDDKNAEEIEWNQGHVNLCKKELDSDDYDDDDDDDDDYDDYDNDNENNEYSMAERETKKSQINPLKLFATHSGTASGKNIKINLSRKKICSRNPMDVGEKFYVNKFCEKYDKVDSCKERFKPNQLKNNDKTIFLTSAEHVKRRLGNKWEISQATPPVPIYRNVVMIGLSESLKLQKEQAEKLKEMEQKHATEKLIQNMSLKMGNELPINNTTEYRSNRNTFEESVGDGNEFNHSGSESEDKENLRFSYKIID